MMLLKMYTFPELAYCTTSYHTMAADFRLHWFQPDQHLNYKEYFMGKSSAFSTLITIFVMQ